MPTIPSPCGLGLGSRLIPQISSLSVSSGVRSLVLLALALVGAVPALAVASPAELAAALDLTGAEVSTSGSAPWFAQSATTQDGVAAAQSGAITHDESSVLTVTVNGPGELSFWWRVSSEGGYDYLRFAIDGVEQHKISGPVTWQQRTYDLAAGPHTLAWSYTKDGSEDAGADAGWVDQVMLQASAGQFTNSTTASGRVGELFVFNLTTVPSSTAFGVTGLPTGLALDPTTGLISGRPAVTGIFDLNLTAQVAAGTIRGRLLLVSREQPDATIFLAPLPTRRFDAGPAVATATTEPPGLPVSITYNGSPLPPTGPGWYTVEARSADPSVQADPVIVDWLLRGRQSISWSLPPQVSLAAGSMAFGAQATSGLPISGAVLTGPATLVDGRLVFSGPGAVTVRATQAGDDVWEAAPASERSFVIVTSVATEPLVAGADGLDPVLREALVFDGAGSAGDPRPRTRVENGLLGLEYVRRLDAPWLSYQVEVVDRPDADATVLAILPDEMREPIDADRERVTVWDSEPVGDSPTRFLRLRVTNAGTIVRVLAPAPSVAVGGTLTLRAATTGAPVTGYTWRRDGEPISGADESTFTIVDASSFDAGRYAVSTSGPGGFALSPAVAIEVIEAPTGIFLTGGQFFTTAIPGSPVGGLRAFGADGTPVTRFLLVAGEGDEDNANFMIVGREIRANTYFAGAARPFWNLRVRAVDGRGGEQEQRLTLQLVDASGVPAVVRVLNDNAFAPPFPVVEAWPQLDFDLEALWIVWWGEPGAAYAIERSVNGGPWDLISGARYLETDGPARLMQYLDFGFDFFGREYAYRVRRVDLPPSATQPIARPSVGALSGVARLGLLYEGRTIIGPVGTYADDRAVAPGASRLEWQQQLVDPTGRADYYEIVIPGLIGVQMRTTSPEIFLPLSRNFRQGEQVALSVFAYAWDGELVAARVDEPLRTYFDEIRIDRLSNQTPFTNPAIDLAYIYGTSHQGTLRTRYGRVDRRSGSVILDLILDAMDGSEPNKGSFRLLLPQGLTAGQPRWSAVNDSDPLTCSMEAPAVDYDFPFFVGGDWRRQTGGFRWTTYGPNYPSPDATTYGYFDLKPVAQDAAFEVWEIELVANAGYDSFGFGTMTVIIPRRY